MDKIKFNDYCSSFLMDQDLGSLVFFNAKDVDYTYQDLIQKALGRAHYFKNSPDLFFALKMESPYLLFANLLGALIAQKKALILSNKEPQSSISKIQENIPFTQILTDDDSKSEFDDLTILNNEVDYTSSAFYIMSSGSSGFPKAIPLSLDNVFYSPHSLIHFFQMNSKDVSFFNPPHHHIGGLMILWRAFFSMGKVTTDKNAEFNFISLVPLQLQRMLESSPDTKKLQDCRGVLIGGAPLESFLKEKALKQKIPLFETYGMSETCSLVMLNGRPLPGQVIKLDQEGYFLLKGKTLSSNAPLDQDGFYHTKDIGILNTDGTYSFKCRGDLLFKSAGELINPLALESKLRELNWITEAVVTPIKHSKWTQAAVLVYKSSDSTKTESDLKDYLKNHFHPYQIPKYFILAPHDLIPEGIKPRRYEISRFAQLQYYKELFHFLYVPHSTAKKLVVFFHGFMEDHTDLIPLMDNHKEISYLFIDLPGHGQSKASHFQSRTELFLELGSLIQFVKKENEALVFYGYSMGGRVALELVLTHLTSDLLILESAHFGLESNTEKEERLKNDRLLFSNPSLSLIQFFHDWYKNPIFGTYNLTAHYQMDLEKKLSHDPQEWQAALEFFSPGLFPYDKTFVAHKLSTQKIIGITGPDDIKYTSHYKEMSFQLPCMSLYTIEHSGHNPHKTHLNEVKDILKNFC